MSLNPFDLINQETDSEVELEHEDEEAHSSGNILNLLILAKAQKKDAIEKTKFDGRRPMTASPYLRRSTDGSTKLPLSKSLYWPSAPQANPESNEEYSFAEPRTPQWLLKALFRNASTTPLRLSLAETVIFKDGEPFRWTYTDPKTGVVTKRPKKWLRPEHIRKYFSKKINDMRMTRSDFPRMQQDNYIVVQRLMMGTEVSTTPLTKADVDIFFKGEGSSKNAVASFQEFIPTRSNSNGASVYSVEYRKREGAVHLNCFVLFKTRTGRKTNHDMDDSSPPADAGGIGGGDGGPNNGKKGQFHKKKMKSYATKINQKAIVMTKDIVRYVEAIWKEEIVCFNANFIVDMDDRLVFVDSSDIFTIESQLVRRKEDGEFGDTDDYSYGLTSNKEENDPCCEGDYCNVVFEHGFEVKERQERENDWRTLWKSRTEEANQPVFDQEYRTIAFKSIILARYERDIDEVAKKANVNMAQSFLPQATLSTDGGLNNIQPAMFYKRVTVCENCYKMYVKLDRQRELHAEKARKAARETFRQEISELAISRHRKMDRMDRENEKRRLADAKKEQERSQLLELANESGHLVSNEMSRASLRGPTIPAHLNTASNTDHMRKHPVTTGVSPYYDKKTMYNVKTKHRKRAPQELPKKPSIRKRMEAEMDRQISKFLIDSLMRAAPKDMTSPVKAGVPHCSRSYTILLDPK